MPSKESLVLDEAMDIARSSGVEDKLRTVIAKSGMKKAVWRVP